MSASPQPTQSAKRPLEETSSPSRNDQPEAKRPALDKVIKDEARDEEETKETPAESNGDSVTPPPPATDANGESKVNGAADKPEVKDSQGDTVVPDAPTGKSSVGAATANLPQAQTTSAQTHDETTWIHVRAVISSPEAATIIGKGGENVSKIRQMSNAKCTVSDYQKGAVERILTVSGVVDAVAKVSRPFAITIPCSTNLGIGIWPNHPYPQQRASQ